MHFCARRRSRRVRRHRPSRANHTKGDASLQNEQSRAGKNGDEDDQHNEDSRQNDREAGGEKAHRGAAVPQVRDADELCQIAAQGDADQSE